jgi:hypothetical protein
MTASRSAFNGVFSGGQGNIDKIRDAASDILDSDTELAAWMNGGKVIRSMFMASPKVTPPWILTAAMSVRESPAPGGRAKFIVPFGILVGYEDFVTEFDPGDVTVATLYDKIGGLLYGTTTVGSLSYKNVHLAVARYGYRALAQRIESYLPVDFNARRNAKGGSTVEVLFEVDYEAQADIFAPRNLRLPA